MEKEILFYAEKNEYEFKNAGDLVNAQLACANRLSTKIGASKTLVRIEVSTRG